MKLRSPPRAFEMSMLDAARDLLSPDALDAAHWGGGAPGGEEAGAPARRALALYALAHLTLTPLAINLPIAAGAVLPLLASGAAVGRLAGELCQRYVSASLRAASCAYAVVGAASLLGAGTGTLSASVMLLEMTGRVDLALPVFTGVVCAAALTRAAGVPSLYDATVAWKRLPTLPVKRLDTLFSRAAGDLMAPLARGEMLRRHETVRELAARCRAAEAAWRVGGPAGAHRAHKYAFAVVDDADARRFVGAARHEAIRVFLRRFCERHGLREREDLGFAERAGEAPSASARMAQRMLAAPATAAAIGRASVRSEAADEARDLEAQGGGGGGASGGGGGASGGGSGFASFVASFDGGAAASAIGGALLETPVDLEKELLVETSSCDGLATRARSGRGDETPSPNPNPQPPYRPLSPQGTSCRSTRRWSRSSRSSRCSARRRSSSPRAPAACSSAR